MDLRDSKRCTAAQWHARENSLQAASWDITVLATTIENRQRSSAANRDSVENPLKA